MFHDSSALDINKQRTSSTQLQIQFIKLTSKVNITIYIKIELLIVIKY